MYENKEAFERGDAPGTYTILVEDSPIYMVFDPNPDRPIRIQRQRQNVYDHSPPSADELLHRPLQQIYVNPDEMIGHTI